jgi:hypothetical protein
LVLPRETLIDLFAILDDCNTELHREGAEVHGDGLCGDLEANSENKLSIGENFAADCCQIWWFPI